jgi:hypothetical protein
LPPSHGQESDGASGLGTGPFEKAKPPTLTAPINLGRLWLKLHTEAYPGEPLPKLTGKRRAQLKAFTKKLPNDLDVEDTLRTLIHQWDWFIADMDERDDPHDTPSRPHIGYLLVFFDTAVNLVRCARSNVEWKFEGGEYEFGFSDQCVPSKALLEMLTICAWSEAQGGKEWQ